MAKKTSQLHTATHKHYVIAVGYTIFACMVVGIIINTIVPMAHVFTDPHVRILNLTVFMVSLVISALLPALIAYFVGDAGTRSKSKQTHHYNGVMFAVLAYWVDMAYLLVGSVISSPIYNSLPVPLGTAVNFALPVVVAALVVGILAYYYHRGTVKQIGLLNYRPFQYALIAVVVLYLVGTPIQQQLMLPSSTMSSISWVAIYLGFVLVSYAVLIRTRTTILQKITLAITGVTLGQVVIYTASQFAPGVYSIDGNTVQLITVLLTGCMVWAVYLYITRLSYRK